MDKDKKVEQKHVNDVIKEIETQLAFNESEYQKAQLETTLVEKNYGQNAKINTFEVDDQMETNAEVQQQKQLVAKNLENEQILKKQLETLEQLKNHRILVGSISLIQTKQRQRHFISERLH